MTGFLSFNIIILVFLEIVIKIAKSRNVVDIINYDKDIHYLFISKVLVNFYFFIVLFEDLLVFCLYLCIQR